MYGLVYVPSPLSLGHALSWYNPIDWLEKEELCSNIYFSNLSNEFISSRLNLSQCCICVNDPLIGVNAGL